MVDTGEIIVPEQSETAAEALELDIPDLSDDPDELREQLSEFGPKILAKQALIATVASQRILHRLMDPKVKIGQTDAAMMRSAVSSMAKAAELLQKLAPTRFFLRILTPIVTPEGWWEFHSGPKPDDVKEQAIELPSEVAA